MGRFDPSRRSFLKHIGLALAGGWISACAPALANADRPDQDSLEGLVDTASPVPAEMTPTHEPTQTVTAAPEKVVSPTMPGPTPTVQPSPTSALTSTATLPPPPTSGDVLSPAQKTRLATAAIRYTSDSEPEAIQVARSLGYIENDGHPASVCGPLSAAILRDAGLISAYTELHDFWLLNPRHNMSVLALNFPEDQFTWFRTEEPVASFDFTNNPLKAGDFLYLFAGDPGSFEHMLTVSRVDDAGRAYAVTNLNTLDGYIIKEVMLYDPAQPGVGQFADWMDRKYGKIGLTGFGGFLLIRFGAPVPDKSALELQFADDLDAMLDAFGGVWRIYIKQVGGKVVYARHDRQKMHPASVIKVPIAMLFFKSLERLGVKDYQAAIKKGIDGRSYQQLLRSMLVNSEEEASDSLEKAILENQLDVQATMQSWGVERTFLDVRQSTARDIATFYEGLYTGQALLPEATKIVLDYMSAYTPGDDLRLGTIRQFLPPHYPFYNKRGTITGDLLVVADAAVVRIPQNGGDLDYLISAFGYQGEERTTYTKLETALGKLAVLFWQFTRAL